MTDEFPAIEEPRKSWKFPLLLALAIGSLLFAGGVLLWAITHNRDRANRAQVVAVDANRLASEIQRERARNILSTCRDINKRNANTKRELKDAIAALPPERRARARTNTQSTIALIDALVPVRDCHALVEKQARVK